MVEIVWHRRENRRKQRKQTSTYDQGSLLSTRKAYNAGEVELIDIRIPMETAVWQVNFGLKIPANELPERLEELPQDKMLVVACPVDVRSNMARSYLLSQGYQVKYLQGGLLGLMDYLKGGMAKDIKL